jgi:hypothetical protein
VSSIVNELNNGIREMEEQTDAVVNQFLSGNMSVQEFIEQFVKPRQLYHTRLAKREYLTHKYPSIR